MTKVFGDWKRAFRSLGRTIGLAVIVSLAASSASPQSSPDSAGPEPTPPTAGEAAAAETPETIEQQRVAAEAELERMFEGSPELREAYERFKQQRDDALKARPPLAKRLAHTTKDIAGEMIQFYAAVGIMEYWKCFSEKDPTICQQFVEGLADPIHHAGFVLFIMSSRVTTNHLYRMAGHRMWGKAMARYLGLAAGAFVQEKFVEFYHHPKLRDYFSAFKIADPEERKQAKQKALDGFLNSTIKDGHWIAGNAVSLGVLLTAAELSHRTMQLTGIGVKYLDKRMRKSQGTCQTAVSAVIRFFDRSQKPKNLSDRVRRAGTGVGIGLAQTLVFLKYADVVNSFVLPRWEGKVAKDKLESALKALNEKLTACTAGGAQPGQECMAELTAATLAVQETWEKHRHLGFKKVEAVQVRHVPRFLELDQKITQINLFYEWFQRDGMKADSDYWRALQKMFYKKAQSPDDIKSEATRFADAYLCGVEPENGFQGSRTILRFPDPTRWNHEVRPYRVSKGPFDCSEVDSASLSKKIGVIRQHSSADERTEAYIRFLKAGFEIRNRMMWDYVNLTRIYMTEALEGKEATVDGQGDDQKLVLGEALAGSKLSLGSAGLPSLGLGQELALPAGALQSYDVERAFWLSLAARYKNASALSALFVSASDSAFLKRSSAQDLWSYVQEPDDERKVAPYEIFLLTDPTKKADWHDAVQYYQSFIIE